MTRICEVCEQPLPDNAHHRTKYHPECARVAQAEQLRHLAERRRREADALLGGTTCKVCGKAFRALHRRNVICSVECRIREMTKGGGT